MIRFTTYELKCTLDEQATVGVTEAIVSIKQDTVIITKKLSDGDVSITRNLLTCSLSQEETGQFVSGKKAYIQINLLYSGGDRAATEIKAIDNVTENLIPRVVEG